MASSRREFWDKKARSDNSGDHLKYMVGEETLERAREIHESDVNELNKHLPNLEGKDVLELASGVGRFTGELAKRARHVTSTDFMVSFVEENRKVNEPVYSNITFSTLDATKLDFPPDSFDFVIGLWLLQFLSDSEIGEFLNKILRILRPGGFLFLRDSHFFTSSMLSRETANQLRTIMDYLKFYSKCSCSVNGKIHFFTLDYCFNSKTWVTLRNVPTLFNYRFRKVSRDTNNTNPLPFSLDIHLTDPVYNKECLPVYISVIGEGFAMPGGPMATEKLFASLGENLPQFQSLQSQSQSFNVLDFGCGLGGFGLHVLENSGADVVFLEQSAFACEVLTLKLKEKEVNKGQVLLTDLTQLQSSLDSFSCVSSMHTVDYIKDKERFLAYAKRSLKPNGVLAFGTFCLGNKSCSEQLSRFMELEKLHLLPVEGYTKLLEDLCFSKIVAEDLSFDYLHCVEECIEKLANQQDLSTVTKDAFLSKWTALKNALEEKSLTWTHIIACS